MTGRMFTVKQRVREAIDRTSPCAVGTHKRSVDSHKNRFAPTNVPKELREKHPVSVRIDKPLHMRASSGRSYHAHSIRLLLSPGQIETYNEHVTPVRK